MYAQRMIPILSFDDVLAKLRETPHASRQAYSAMYSTWFGGIVRDPQLMMIPVDDHVVHRGDGVFEAIKCEEGRIYALTRHLDRLERSASLIGLRPPHSLHEMEAIAIETVRAAKQETAMIRLYVTRGPGGFTANPYEPMASQMYLVVTSYKPMPLEKYEHGVSVKISEIRVKEGFFATVKSCNYLPNVLMKKEAVDQGVDFTVSRDENGHLAEGSTENFAIISKDGELVVPGFTRTLKGVTAVRVMELAAVLVRNGTLQGVRNGAISVEDVMQAREAMMLGTTLDVLPVTRFEGHSVATGQVGPICRELQKILREDMRSGPLGFSLS